MDAHDNSLRKYPDGFYYLFAASYGPCLEPAGQGCDTTHDKCGFQANHSVARYRSATLASGSWEYLGPAFALDSRPAGVLFGPGAVFNPNTNLTVLQFNLDNSGGYAGYPLFTAPAPGGTFTATGTSLNVSVGGGSTGHFFVDSDGTGYFIYSAAFQIHIERLSSDFLSVVPGTRFTFPPSFVEAPAMFKRNGVYYALFDWCCCYCMQGSGAQVWTASAPMGPWTEQGEEACVALNGGTGVAVGLGGTPTPGEGCQYVNASQTSATRGQMTFIVEALLADGSSAFVLTADRWQQSPDGTKGHDPETWLPLEFDVSGRVQPLRWLDNFTLDIATAANDSDSELQVLKG